MTGVLNLIRILQKGNDVFFESKKLRDVVTETDNQAQIFSDVYHKINELKTYRNVFIHA